MGVGLGEDRDLLYDQRTLPESKRVTILKGQEALDRFARGISRLLEGRHPMLEKGVKGMKWRQHKDGEKPHTATLFKDWPYALPDEYKRPPLRKKSKEQIVAKNISDFGYVQPVNIADIPEKTKRRIRLPQDYDPGAMSYGQSEAQEHGVKGMKWGIRHTRKDTGRPRPETNVPHPPHRGKRRVAARPQPDAAPEPSPAPVRPAPTYHMPDPTGFLAKKEQYMRTHAEFLARHPELKKLLDTPVEHIGENHHAAQVLLNDTASRQNSSNKVQDLHRQVLDRMKVAGWHRVGGGLTIPKSLGGGHMAYITTSQMATPGNNRVNLYTVKTDDGRVTHYIGKDSKTPMVNPKYIGIKAPSPKPTSPQEMHRRSFLGLRDRPIQQRPRMAPAFASKRESRGFESRMDRFLTEAKRELRSAPPLFPRSLLREAKKPTLYYARPMGMYGSDEEADDIENILEQFPGYRIKASGPKSLRTHGVSRIIKSCRGREKDMDYYHSHINSSKKVVARPVKGRHLSSGVWSEVRHALKKKIPSYLIDEKGKLKRIKAVRLAKRPDRQGVFGTAVLY